MEEGKVLRMGEGEIVRYEEAGSGSERLEDGSVKKEKGEKG